MLLRSSAKRVKRDRKCKVVWTPPAESAKRSTRTSSKRSSIDTDLSEAPFYKNDIKERKRLRWESTPTAKRTGNGPITKVPPDILGLIFSLVEIRSTILLPSGYLLSTLCNDGIKVLVQTCSPSRVKSVNLAYCNDLTDAGILEIVKACPGIEHLNISWCMSLTDLSLRHIATHLKRLKTLAIYGVPVRSYQSIGPFLL
eukprot:gene20254-29508_t